MPARIDLGCIKNPRTEPLFFCYVAPPLRGEKIFKTPQQRAAPKEAIWKCVDVDALGHGVGDFLVYYKGLSWPYEVRAESITEPEANELARKESVLLSIDCPSHHQGG
jgi:hypothetical protein